MPVQSASVLSKTVLLSVAMTVLIGCGMTRKEQLERVAKDWSETIRASQVIPVYPLTEDLRPGDVFLVRTPISQQVAEWDRKGYLPLDDHRVRLGRPSCSGQGGGAIDYSLMYFSGYWEDSFHDSGGNPRARILNPGRLPDKGDSNVAVRSDANAPRVSFPAYTVRVRGGSVLDAAFPLKGIPISLGHLQTDRAYISVLIDDTYTYAADSGQLYRLLRKWIESDPLVREQLHDAYKQNKRPVYLRVVSRVYMAGSMVVSVRNARSVGARAGGGTPAPMVGLQAGREGKPADGGSEMDRTIRALNAQAKAAESLNADSIGLRTQFARASARDVVLRETFPTPLVIGYLAFDVPVFEGGNIGYPLPTWGVLNREVAERTLPSMELLVLLAKGEDSQQVRALRIIGGAVKSLDSKFSPNILRDVQNLLRRPDGWRDRVIPLVRQIQIEESFLDEDQRRKFANALNRAIAGTR